MFPCTQCGECCRRVHLSDLTQYLDRGDGTCRHFEPATHACLIYESRPAVCRVDAGYGGDLAQALSRDEYYRLNATFCNEWQEQAGLPFRYRVLGL